MPRSPLSVLIRLCGIWLLTIGMVVAQERHLYNYTLQHALPEQILPALNAQLAPGSSITPYRQQLILNVTPQEYRAIGELLRQLDTAPHSLLISVRNQNQRATDSEQYSVEGRVGSGNVQVQSGGGRYSTRTETNVVINRGTQQSSDDGTQQVRAVEGMSAFISAGAVYPLRSGPYGQRELTPVTSGFYATARVVGDEVIIDIDQHDDRLRERQIDTQGLQTQVRGRVGEWISLGGVNTTRDDNRREITNYGSSNTSSLADIAIKVDLLN